MWRNGRGSTFLMVILRSRYDRGKSRDVKESNEENSTSNSSECLGPGKYYSSIPEIELDTCPSFIFITSRSHGKERQPEPGSVSLEASNTVSS